MSARALIISPHEDAHTRSVAWALDRKGVSTDVWYPRDFPAYQSISVSISPSGPDEIQIRGPDTALVGLRHKIIWPRRLFPPFVAPNVHASDSRFVRSESTDVLASIQQLAGTPDTFWINSFKAASLARHKLLQLQAAKRCGFRVPNTLVSNDPERIRHFCKVVGGKVIYKAFSSPNWEKDNKRFSFYTSVLSEDHLKQDAALSLAPGIYQPYVEKAYELRIVVMGASCFAVRIDVDASGYREDWRANQILKRVTYSAFVLSDDLTQRAVSLIASMGLVFGCIDVIVSPEGDETFLEVNHQGQFLWMEDVAPSLPILDAFSSFMASRDPGYRYAETRPLVRLSEFDEATQDRAPLPSSTHAPLPEEEYIHAE